MMEVQHSIINYVRWQYMFCPNPKFYIHTIGPKTHVPISRSNEFVMEGSWDEFVIFA